MTTNPAPAGAQHAPRGHRPILILITAVAAALVLAACSAARGAKPTAVQAAQGQYVALGDSYTAGPGIPGQAGVSAGCQRSSRSYPALVAQSLRLNADQVRDVSCSGATIADLSAPQPTSDGTNPAQLTALSAATTLVTPGIGGNDIDWAAEKIQTAAGHLAGAPNAAGAWPSRTWIFGSSAAVRRSRHPRNDPGTPMRPNGTAAGKATPIPATPRTRSVPPASGGVTHSGAE